MVNQEHSIENGHVRSAQPAQPFPLSCIPREFESVPRNERMSTNHRLITEPQTHGHRHVNEKKSNSITIDRRHVQFFIHTYPGNDLV